MSEFTQRNPASDCPSAIEVVDFSAFLDESHASLELRQKAATEIAHAFQTTGLVYLKNIPVAPNTIKEAFDWVSFPSP